MAPDIMTWTNIALGEKRETFNPKSDKLWQLLSIIVHLQVEVMSMLFFYRHLMWFEFKSLCILENYFIFFFSRSLS